LQPESLNAFNHSGFIGLFFAVRQLGIMARNSAVTYGRLFWRTQTCASDPVEAIKYHMDQNGPKPRDLIPFIGSRNRVHEALNRRPSLTLKMIWRLHEGLGIPAESLIKGERKRAA
jgi:antitoxin component HigA of HigAB toxin-antitoxin module